MITDLRIQNFAIIDRLELQFAKGLIIFTGETGAGKSIMMDAIEMLLGGRAEISVIRSDADRANVEGNFKLNGATQKIVNEILKREDLLDDANYVTLSREIRREGRSIARINGRTVNLSLLREIGAALVDVHGQTEHLSLLDINAHLGLLDRFADIETPLQAYRKTYADIQALRRELNDLRAAQRDADRRMDMLTFQADEIESASLKLGEDDELKKERDRLANAESLATLAQEALAALDEGSPETPAITDLIGQVSQALVSLSRIDASQTEISNRAEELLENISDLSHDLRNYLEGIEFNPRRLEQVEERLDMIHRLLRKYGGTIATVIDKGKEARAQLETITTAGDRIVELENKEGTLLRKLGEHGTVLSTKRKTAAQKLSKGIELQLDDLKMASAQFAVDFQTKPDQYGIPLSDGSAVAFTESGYDRIEFLIAPNPGEGLKPLAKIASGGETSRLMLALKNVLANADQVPSLIFDEIDQGIGGRVGTIVGQKLWNLARSHQVMVITHLPQLAAFGEQHFQVQKVVNNGRTTTQVNPLVGNDRLLELAQMLGEVSEGTLRSAHDLLQTARTSVKTG